MLLVERLNPNQANLVVESILDESTNKKNLYMKGIFIQGGQRNLIGRVYPVSEISKAVDDINSILAKGESVLGECDHPEKLTINLDRVSHKIDKMWMEGNNGYGKLRIVPTPLGEVIRVLIESDVKLGVSSRGSGDVDDQGNVSSFEIVTVDVVQRPSAPSAFPVPIYESMEGRRGRIINDLARAVADDPKAQRHLHTEVLTWIKNLNP